MVASTKEHFPSFIQCLHLSNYRLRILHQNCLHQGGCKGLLIYDLANHPKDMFETKDES